MSISDGEYSVLFGEFAKRHYIKSFEKKYGDKCWTKTNLMLERWFQSPSQLVSRNIAETIVDVAEVKICKIEFGIVGTNQSRRASGNRCIIAVHEDKRETRVLLVYHKNNLKGSGGETVLWKKLIKNNYPEYKDIIII